MSLQQTCQPPKHANLETLKKSPEKPGDWDFKPGDWDLKPGDWDLKPGDWDLKPGDFQNMC